MKQKIESLINKYSKWLFYVYWVLNTNFSLYFMNSAGIAFLFNLQSSEASRPNYIFAVSSFILMVLYGWLFFTILWKGNNIFLVPDEVKQDSVHHFFPSLLSTLFIQLCGLIVIEISLRIQPDKKQNLSDLELIGITIVVVIWSTYMIIQKTKLDKTERLSREAIPDLTIQSKALSKIHRKLSNREQEILKTLVYEENQFQSFSMQRVILVAFIFFITSLIIEFFQEIIQRI